MFRIPPSLLPKPSDVWIPRLEIDENELLLKLEAEYEEKLASIRATPAQTPIGMTNKADDDEDMEPDEEEDEEESEEEDELDMEDDDSTGDGFEDTDEVDIS